MSFTCWAWNPVKFQLGVKRIGPWELDKGSMEIAIKTSTIFEEIFKVKLLFHSNNSRNPQFKLNFYTKFSSRIRSLCSNLRAPSLSVLSLAQHCWHENKSTVDWTSTEIGMCCVSKFVGSKAWTCRIRKVDNYFLLWFYVEFLLNRQMNNDDYFFIVLFLYLWRHGIICYTF